MSNQQFWTQGQQTNVFNQSTSFTPNQQDFPGLNEQNSQQQSTALQASNPFVFSEFKATSTEFVPQGVVAGQEAFPDLDSGIGGSKKKKGGPTKAQIEAEKLAAQQLLSTKGKPASFFYVPPGNAVSTEQMVFLFQHYPQYTYSPEAVASILAWLIEEVKRIDAEERWRQQELDAKSSQQRNNNQYGDEYYEEELLPYEESQFGFSSTKNKKKVVASTAGKVNPNQKRDDKEKQERQLAKQEEKIKTKIVRDVVVKVDEETIQQVDETRQPCSLVFIGHVDAGKSTISGQIMYQMGCVDERTIEKYKKDAKDKGRDSWWLAYCMDCGEEEKAKGKTVEVGRATFNTATKQMTVFDAPGHKNYVPNMIVGAALADYAGLVISARKGEFEAGFEKDGQTREHVQLAKSLGVQKLVVVVNKMDEPSVNWSEARWNEIRTKLGPFLEKSGYPESDVSYVPISGLVGDNIVNKVDPKVCSWFKGDTLMEILDRLPVQQRDPNGPLRMPILEKIKEQGVVAHGKIESGTIKIGDKVMISPSGYPAQIGLILDHKNESVRYARPGENVQVTLIHINEESMLNKGDVIVSRDAPIPVTMLFEAEIDVLELLDHKMVISRGYSCIMHCHTIAEDIIIKDLLTVTEKNLATNLLETKEQPKFIKSFSQCKVRISTKVPIAIEKFDVLPQLGRFTLRDEGRTIAVGKILKYKPCKVESTIQVAGATAEVTKQVADLKVADKNEALVFDLETGSVAPQKKGLDSIAEE